MRNAVFAALLAATVVNASGCIGVCGAYEGSSDRLYTRDGEMIIACDNGGVVANLTATTVEGRLMTGVDSTQFAIRGEDGALAFDWVANADGSYTAPQLEGANWTALPYDATTFDHAHVLCADLETRAWWNQP
jgi:hypothetical protein